MGDKVVAFCDRDCNIISPFIAAAGNRNESPLLRDALPKLSTMARAIGMDLQGSTVSLDGVYDCRATRRAIFNRNMRPNIPENSRGRKTPKGGRKLHFDAAIFEERSRWCTTIGKSARVASQRSVSRRLIVVLLHSSLLSWFAGREAPDPLWRSAFLRFTPRCRRDCVGRREPVLSRARRATL
jgi:hypothetical protein